MKREFEIRRVWASVAASVALGAAAMYVFDPDKGKRRRALARDKTRSLLGDTRRAAAVAARDTTHRMQGLRARALRLFRRAGVPDDLQLIERVRARMGRLVSHPHAIQVGANNGRVTLSGAILAHEVQRLLGAVRNVWGVSDIEDRLVVYDSTESISSLQGGSGDRRMRSEFMQENWTPALRVAAVLGGTVMALYGLRQRSLAGCALIGVGLGVAARGATNVPMKRLAGIATGRRAMDLQKTIHLEAPPENVFDLWTNWENFPRFMSHVQEVRDLGDGRSHWVVSGPAGTGLEWDAVVTREIRPQVLSWKTEPGSLVQHVGSVQFEPFADGTRVTVRMTYNAAGGVGRALATLLGSDPRQQLDDDLARMKTFIERGTPPHDVAQPSDAARPPLH